MDEFFKKNVVDITGLDPRLVQFYVDEGVIVPEIYRGSRRGERHRFSRKNLFEFAAIKELNDFGMNISIIRKIMPYVSNLDHEGHGKFDYEKRLKEIKPRILIHKGSELFRRESVKSSDIYIIFQHPLVLKNTEKVIKNGLSIIDEEDLKNVISVIVIDLWALYKRMSEQI